MMVRCKLCNESLSLKVFRKHLLEEHNIKPELTVVRKNPNANTTKTTSKFYVYCIKRHARLKVEHLKNHFDKKHTALEPAQIVSQERKIKLNNKPIKHRKPKSKADTYISQRPAFLNSPFRGLLDNYHNSGSLDAARDSRAIRDRGQWGSYPSYDRFDDESGPG